MTPLNDLAEENKLLRRQRDALLAAAQLTMEEFNDRYDGAPDAGYQWMGWLMHALEAAIGLAEKRISFEQCEALDKPQPLEHTDPQYDARPSNPPAP